MFLFPEAHDKSDTDLMTPPSGPATMGDEEGEIRESETRRDPGLTVYRVTDEAGFDALKSDWNELTERDSVRATMFQSYAWQRSWWKQFGSGYSLHILEIRKADRLVGLLPFCVETHHVLGGIPFRILKFIGSQIGKSASIHSTYSLSDFLDIIIDNNFREEVVQTVISVLEYSRMTFDRIELDELPEGGTFRTEVMPEIEKRKWSYEEMEQDVCPCIDLPESMSSYLHEVSGSVRKKYRRSKRYVTKQNLYRVERVRTREEFESAFRWFVDLHQKRWHEQGFPGIFEDDRIRDFMEDAALAFLEENNLRFTYAIDHDGRYFAVDFAFAFKEEMYDLQRAYDPGSPLANKSPGWTLQYFLIKDAVEADMDRFHLLRGEYSYKDRVTNASPVNRMIVFRNSGRHPSLKHRLWRTGRFVRRLWERISREMMLVRIHYRQWGPKKVLQKYVPFLIERIRESRS